MRWYAWVAVIFFLLVAGLGIAITSVAETFVNAIDEGVWMTNSFIADGVTGALRAGEDPRELYQFYVGFGLAVVAVGLLGAATSGVLGFLFAPKSLTTSTPKTDGVATPPAGWYPIEDGTGRVGWWDGSRWIQPTSPGDTR